MIQNDNWKVTPEQQIVNISRKLMPMVTRVSGCTKSEALYMTSIVFTAIFQQLLEKGRVLTPFGDIVMGISPRQTYPLRVKLFMSTPEAAFMNTGSTKVPSPLMAMMLPEHYEVLAEYQEKAYKYKEEKQNDALQKSNSSEL